MKTIYYCEPDLSDHGGHLYNTIRNFKQAFADLNQDQYELEIVVSEKCDESIKKEFSAITLFKNYNEIKFSGRFGFLIRELTLILKNFRSLYAIAKTGAKGAIIYYNTAQSYHLFAIFLILSVKPRTLEKVILTLRLSNFLSKKKKAKRFPIYFLAINLLKILEYKRT